jgi:hypothetical protein
MTTIVHGGASGAPHTGAHDQFEIIFRPAKPTLDALIDVRKPLAWLNQRRGSSRPMFDPKEALELLDIVPHADHLAKAGVLFLEAEQHPAPEAWLHLAIGLMLDSEPAAANLSDATRCAVADSAYRDPDVWQDYEPGFSPPVVVRAIREARLQGALSPGIIVNLFMKHRRLFKALNADVDALMRVRWDAEDAAEKNPQRPLLGYDDPDSVVPFEPRLPARRF